MIKFSFEGSREDLIATLQALQGNTGGFRPSVGAVPAIVPQSVSQQRPPPPPTPLTPPEPASDYARVMPGCDAATMEPLHVDPVYDQADGSSNPAPRFYPEGSPYTEPLAGVDLSKVALNPEAGRIFSEFAKAWVVGFECDLDEEGNPMVEQPDRLTLLKNIGSGEWPAPILRWIGEFGSLQGALHHILGWDDLDRIDRLAANISQVAHAAFPDLVGVHDYSSKWKRKLQES